MLAAQRCSEVRHASPYNDKESAPVPHLCLLQPLAAVKVSRACRCVARRTIGGRAVPTILPGCQAIILQVQPMPLFDCYALDKQS